mgnify:FL=1
MENKKIIVANLKMNLSKKEIEEYVEQIRTIQTKRVVFCPSALYIPYFLGYDYEVGIQQISEYSQGAYTGQVSSSQAASLGLVLTLVGHSECRKYFHETEEQIHKKIVQALHHKLNVMLCVGETKEQRDMLKTDSVIRKQVLGALKGLSSEKLNHVYIAYEPVWAIGTNEIPSKRDIEETINFIKHIVKSKLSFSDIPVLYGGSINSKNIKTLNKIENCSGFLVGGSSLKVKELCKIIEVAVKE